MILSKNFSSYLVNRIKNINKSDVRHKINAANNIISATELDRYADLHVVEKYVAILEISNKTALVSGFTTELGDPIRVWIVTAAIRYDCEYTSRKLHITVIHNALHFKNMEINLIYSIMMQIIGLDVDEYPNFLAKTPSELNHLIYFSIKISVFYFKSKELFHIFQQNPREEEVKVREENYFLLTPKLPSWNPYTKDFRDQEYGMVDYNGNIKNSKSSPMSDKEKRIMEASIEQMFDDKIYDPIHFIIKI